MRNSESYCEIKSFIDEKFNLLINEKNYDGMFSFFIEFYNKIVKTTESHEHYHQCYDLIELYAKYYGDYLKTCLPNYSKSNQSQKKICYFFPNIDNDLAHIELFSSAITNHDIKSELKIYVASFSSINYKSRFIKNLEI